MMMKSWGVFASTTIERWCSMLVMWLTCLSVPSWWLVGSKGRQVVLRSGLKLKVQSNKVAHCTWTSEWWEEAAAVFIFILFAEGPLSPFPFYSVIHFDHTQDLTLVPDLLCLYHPCSPHPREISSWGKVWTCCQTHWEKWTIITITRKTNNCLTPHRALDLHWSRCLP